MYLLVVLCGPFVLLYVPGKVFVPGDATATINSILAHETLYRASIAVGIVSELIFVLVVLTLYRLLKGVDQPAGNPDGGLHSDRRPARLPGHGESGGHPHASRAVADFLSVFDKPQRDALATLLINFDQQGVIVSEVFWGLWLLPLGLLVYRSRFLPRFLGVWLFINGLAYLALSATGLFSPEHTKIVRTVTMPALFGEVALMLWLLIIGARVKGQFARQPEVPRKDQHGIASS